MNPMLHQVLNLPRATKRLVVITVDILLALIAVWAAYSIRFEALHWPQGHERWIYLLAPALAVPLFAGFGLYRTIFRFVGLHSLLAIGKAVAVYALVLTAFHRRRRLIPRLHREASSSVTQGPANLPDFLLPKNRQWRCGSANSTAPALFPKHVKVQAFYFFAGPRGFAQKLQA